MHRFQKTANTYKEKLLKIKICAFDIDGILTNGQVFYDGKEGGFNRFTHTSDGYGLMLLKRAGIKVGVISAGDSLSVRKRFIEDLNLDFVYLGEKDKRKPYRKIIAEGFQDENILYMGDDFFDLPLLKVCGFSATVPGASLEIQESVDYITERFSGMGCVREVIDILRYAQKITPHILEVYPTTL